MIVNRMKYGEFRIGDVYRVRGVNVERTPERQVILTKQQTNFLSFNKDSLIYRELAISVKEDVEDDDPDTLLLMAQHATKVTTETEDQFIDPKNVQLYKLQDLFTDYDSLTVEEKHANRFRVRLQVLKIDPSDFRECCVAMCSESGETQSCKDLPANGKVTCNGSPA